MSDPTINAMLKIHSSALVNMSMDGVIRFLEKQIGPEQPADEYARGYRDAMELMIIQVRQIKHNFNNLGKNEEQN